ncbi:hypothetical protein V1514DRAFT_295011 [Lipomyces japonicus]|uniref:uncharacterized protein n=1 Tax=Lipomyces japonicus TaxID=56871 RepID=UPI0034CD2079
MAAEEIESNADTRGRIPDSASSVASDDERDSAPLLTTESTNEIPYPTDPDTVNAIFATDEQSAENGGTRREYIINNSTISNLKKLPAKIKAAIIIGGLILFILILRGFWLLTFGAERKDEVCLTPGCVTAASGVLADGDFSASPCDNFYQYVCGGWEASHDLRPEQASYSTGSVMFEDSLRISHRILESPFPGGDANDREIWDKATGVYAACMNTDRITSLGATPIYPILENILQKYPVYEGKRTVKNWVEGDKGVTVRSQKIRSTVDDLTETVLYLQKFAITALLQFDIDADDVDPDYVALKIYQPLNGLPSKEYYQRETITLAYADAIKSVLQNVLTDANASMTATELEERYAELAKHVVEFEKQVADIGLDLEDLFDGSKTYHPYPLNEVQQLFKDFDFKFFISSLAGENKLPSKVIVTYPKFLQDLNTVVANTPRETLQTYFLWKAIEVLASHLSDDATRPVTEFRNKLRGIESSVKTERWQTCVREVDSLTGWILGKYYVDAAFSPTAKQLGEEIIIGIKESFIQKLNLLPWMDSKTKNVAILKVNNLIQKIGYPDASPDIQSAADLAKTYKDLHISPTGYFDNYADARKLASEEEWNNLGEKTDRAQWLMTPATVNAYYNPPLGEIVFPAGILQPPVFSEFQPSYLNYGAFGSVAGHELSHAFDNQGRNYDEHGTLNDWWTPQVSEEFETRAQCFVDQYSQYSVIDEEGNVLHVNGKLTEGENIADNGGIAAAFDAWQKYEIKNPSPLLPGLNFTREQLFFINYGRWWCGKTRPGTAAQLIYTDPHSPAFVRVLAAVENSQPFIDAFQCTSKSPQCVLW